MGIKVRRRCPGRYDVDTPSGTYRLILGDYSKDDPNCAGMPRVKWYLENPGSYSDDSDFPTKREAIEYVRTIEKEKVS